MLQARLLCSEHKFVIRTHVQSIRERSEGGKTIEDHVKIYCQKGHMVIKRMAYALQFQGDTLVVDGGPDVLPVDIYSQLRTIARDACMRGVTRVKWNPYGIAALQLFCLALLNERIWNMFTIEVEYPYGGNTSLIGYQGLGTKVDELSLVLDQRQGSNGRRRFQKVGFRSSGDPLFKEASFTEGHSPSLVKRRVAICDEYEISPVTIFDYDELLSSLKGFSAFFITGKNAQNPIVDVMLCAFFEANPSGSLFVQSNGSDTRCELVKAATSRGQLEGVVAQDDEMGTAMLNHEAYPNRLDVTTGIQRVELTSLLEHSRPPLYLSLIMPETIGLDAEDLIGLLQRVRVLRITRFIQREPTLIGLLKELTVYMEKNNKGRALGLYDVRGISFLAEYFHRFYLNVLHMNHIRDRDSRGTYEVIKGLLLIMYEDLYGGKDTQAFVETLPMFEDPADTSRPVLAPPFLLRGLIHYFATNRSLSLADFKKYSNWFLRSIIQRRMVEQWDARVADSETFVAYHEYLVTYRTKWIEQKERDGHPLSKSDELFLAYRSAGTPLHSMYPNIHKDLWLHLVPLYLRSTRMFKLAGMNDLADLFLFVDPRL